MAAPTVRTEYEQLEQIARTFSGEAAACRQVLRRVQLSAEDLRGGNWVGRGAAAFYAEMESTVLPSLGALAAALERASLTVRQILALMRQAEQEAAAFFRLAAGEPLSIPRFGDGPGLPEWLSDLLEGIFLGDFSEDSSLVKLLAQIGVGFVPYAGQAADVRDIIANLRNVIEGRDLAWMGLALSVVAIIPGLDALRAGKVLEPMFRALGDKGSREAIEFLVKNPNEVGRVARTLGTLLDHPEVVKALAENPDAALRLIREGAPEVVEAYARYGDDAFNILRIPSSRQAFEGFDRLVSQRPLDAVPGTDLTPQVSEFVTPGVHGDFNQYRFGTPGEFDTKLLWTIDDQGAHFVPEDMFWDSTRMTPSHTNVSDTAYFGGEAWRTGPNEITINAGSGAFGYNRQVAKGLAGEELELYTEAMQARFDRASEYFRKLGFEVKQIPLTER